MKLVLSPRWRWIEADRVVELEPRLLTLLAAIGQGASLRTAAATVGVSYRHAWGMLGRWGERLGAPLVTMARGRGTRLTPLGQALVEGDRVIRERLTPLLEEAAGELEQRLATVLETGDDRLHLCASHDLVLGELRTLLRRRGVSLVLRFCGGLESLRRLRAGECDLAGFHLPEGELGRTLVRRYRHLLGRAWRLVTVVRRRQGLMTAPGNPKGIREIADLARRGVRFVNRQPGSGTRLALDALLRQAGRDPAGIEGYEDEEYTHSAVAALVASGAADVGLGLEAAARRFGLDFVPLFWERYFLVSPPCRLAEPVGQTLFAVLESEAFRERAAALPGYAAEDAGMVLAPTALAGLRSVR